MIPFMLLIIVTLLLRGLGAVGVDALASWVVAARFALAAMFLFTASAHFTSMKDDLIRMVPKGIPSPRGMVLLTGILEILGAIGLLIPQLRLAAGIGLIVMMVLMLPANIHAARAGITLRGKGATPLWLRIPMQVVYIALTWWVSRPGA